MLGVNHATSNLISYVPDRHGTANSAVAIGLPASFAPTSWSSASWVRPPQTFITALTDFTWCSWANFDSGTKGANVLFSHGHHSGQLWYGVTTSTIGSTGFFRQHWQTTNCDVNTEIPSKGSWNHLCVVGDRAGTTLTVFANGVLKGSCNDMAFSASISENIADRPPLIGAYNDAGHQSQQFHGLIDDVLFYSRQLTSTEIAQIAAA